MKRVIAFAVFIAGAFMASIYLYYGGTASFGDLWQAILSYFRRGYTIVSETAQSASSSVTGTPEDPYQKALSLIAKLEGFSAHAYPDADGFSIGYGHFIKPEDPYDSNSVITESEGWTLLEQDARSAQACVTNNVTQDLSVTQIAALISFTYNVGCGAFQSSTLLRQVNAGNFAAAAAEFPKWNKSQGKVLSALVSRRQMEQEVFTA